MSSRAGGRSRIRRRDARLRPVSRRGRTAPRASKRVIQQLRSNGAATGRRPYAAYSAMEPVFRR
jgi:hypothetical protein